MTLVDNEVHIADAEGGRFTVGQVGVFSWVQKEEEGKYDHVHYSLCTGGVGTEADGGGCLDDVNG
jgi:hypothetical protein